MNAATINELTVAYDEANNKKYTKGKFLGKVLKLIGSYVTNNMYAINKI